MSEYGNEKRKETSYSKSVLKTLEILDQFKESDELGITDLAEATGIPPSTVQRMVNTLVMKQYLQKSLSRRKYCPGTSLFAISSRAEKIGGKLELVKQCMEEFTSETHENINFAVLSGAHVTYIMKVDSPELLKPDFQIGVSYPAFTTSLGRCMLAYEPWEKVKQLYDMQSYKEISKEDFRALFKEVRKNGYATESEQFQPGLWCTAAPVIDSDGKVIAALSTCIPLLRLDDKRKKRMCGRIVDAARSVSEVMG
jgi:IclR family KDG regulon transcriptional repressor